jgi:hypothetical protein
MTTRWVFIAWSMASLQRPVSRGGGWLIELAVIPAVTGAGTIGSRGTAGIQATIPASDVRSVKTIHCSSGSGAELTSQVSFNEWKKVHHWSGIPEWHTSRTPH